MNPLLSIIIPTYNRDSLLGQTLDSILAQSYKNWECIIVDDGSEDNTFELVDFYVKKDQRFQYYLRPQDRPKGANACRNYGFEKSKGEFINWFDSDDLMTVDFLEKKVDAALSGYYDFVITKTECFRGHRENVIHKNENYYTFEEYPITNYNYVAQNINWLTYDFFVKRELAEKVKFNERLSSFQERNFFCKITCFSTKAKILDAYVTKVRVHENSIQAKLKINEEQYYQNLQKFFFETWKDIKNIGPKASVDYLFNRTVDYSMHFVPSPNEVAQISFQFAKNKQLGSLFWYLSFQVTKWLTGRGHYFKKKVHNLR